MILSGHGTIETAVEATRLGAADFVEKPLSLNKLLRTVEKALRGVRPAGRGALSSDGKMPPLFVALARSRRVRDLRERAERLAPHAAPLLIVGETGTGRDSLAVFIHQAGQRRDAPFIRVPGASLLAANAAQLLLGTETAAGVEHGLLEQAGTGTLFISNIEDASTAAQSLLAGVLEARGYARFGQVAQHPLTARVIASARPRTLVDPVTAGVRPDLVEQLGSLRIDLPPLREYAEDISELLRYTAEDLADREQLPFRRFSFAAQNRLRNYPWPGNLRELNSLVRRLLAAAGPEEVSLEEVERELRPSPGVQEPLVKQDLLALPLREAREQFERAYLTEQLALCGGKVGQLAKRVGMERTHLYRKLRSLGIDFRGMLSEE